MTHYIKILPEYFNAVATGRKSFEVRCNDRKYTVGTSSSCRRSMSMAD